MEDDVAESFHENLAGRLSKNPPQLKQWQDKITNIKKELMQLPRISVTEIEKDSWALNFLALKKYFEQAIPLAIRKDWANSWLDAAKNKQLPICKLSTDVVYKDSLENAVQPMQEALTSLAEKVKQEGLILERNSIKKLHQIKKWLEQDQSSPDSRLPDWSIQAPAAYSWLSASLNLSESDQIKKLQKRWKPRGIDVHALSVTYLQNLLDEVKQKLVFPELSVAERIACVSQTIPGSPFGKRLLKAINRLIQANVDNEDSRKKWAGYFQPAELTEQQKNADQVILGRALFPVLDALHTLYTDDIQQLHHYAEQVAKRWEKQVKKFLDDEVLTLSLIHI